MGYINSEEFIDNIEFNNDSTPYQDDIPYQSEKRLRWWQKVLSYLRIKKYKNEKIIPTSDTTHFFECNDDKENELHKKWTEFRKTFEAEEKYGEFIDFKKESEDKLKIINKDVENFTLTVGDKTSSLINQKKLNDFQKEISNDHQQRIKGQWDQMRNKENFSLDSITDICNLFIDKFVSPQYSFIDWEAGDKQKQLFSLIEELDIPTLTEQLNKMQKQSVPFIAYHDFSSENNHNKITKIVYTGNQDVKDMINGKDLPNVDGLLLLNASRSLYIENKICMFQFYPIEDIDKICDCMCKI